MILRKVRKDEVRDPDDHLEPYAAVRTLTCTLSKMENIWSRVTGLVLKITLAALWR